MPLVTIERGTVVTVAIISQDKLHRDGGHEI